MVSAQTIAMARNCLLPVLIAAALLHAMPLRAQDFRYFRQQAWSTEQGLPQDTVHQILQTQDGFLWVATEGGLARYDGASFTVFNHANQPAFRSDDACCLAQDKSGDLWIGTSDGLVRKHGDSFEAVSDPKVPLTSAIESLAITSTGNLVVLTAGGLLQNDNGHFTPVPNASSATGASNSTSWTYTNTAVHFEQGKASRDWKITQDLPGSRVESLFVDRNGLAWVGTNDGVTVLNSQDKQGKPTTFLRGEAVLQTFQDREGSYWFGTENSGLHLLRALKFRALLNNMSVRTLTQASDAALWVGTREDGLRRIDPAGNVTEPVNSLQLTSPVILSLAAGTGGSVWVGTPDGLNHVEANGAVRQITSADGLPDDYIQSLASNPDGGVWAGTRHGLAHINGSAVEVFTKANGLAGDLVGTLLRTRNGELWMGTSGGLSRRLPDGGILSYGAQQGLGQGIVSALTEDTDGTVWIVTTGGTLSRFASGKLQPIHRRIFGGQVGGLVADSEGFLWSRDLGGIERVSIADLHLCTQTSNPCTPHTSLFGQADGIPSNEMIREGSPAIGRLADGEIWSVTRRGVAVTNPRQMPLNALPPPVVVESFTVDDLTPKPGEDITRIPFGHTRFTFEYAALSFVVPSAIHYRVKLEGLDSTWIDVGSRRSATYTNLPPRTYRFRVQAANNDGVWNNTGATLLFKVVPPVYRRWWFITLSAILLSALATTLYRLRLRRLRKQFDLVLMERNRLAREIHDTLAQDFVGISLQLDMVSQLLSGNKTEAAIAQVQGTRKLVTDGLAEARQSIWELRANTAQDSLPSRLRKIVARYASDAVPVRTEIGGAFRPLDNKLESEILRIAQEALSNVQRHSGATAASVDLHYGSAMLVLTIEDNGRGFGPAAAVSDGHFGLSGMQERAGLLGAALDIASQPGEGTTVRLTLKIDGARRGSTWKPESK